MNSKTSFLEQDNIFWHEWQLNPHSTAYNRSLVFDIRGMLERSRLFEAISSLVNSYDVFRHYFSEHDGQIKIHSSAPVKDCVEWIDLSDTENSHYEVQLHIDRTKNHLFDLENPPLFKATLIKAGNDHYVLALCFHHIIVDALSEKLIIEYLSAYYNQQADPKNFLSPSIYPDHKEQKNIASKGDKSSSFWQEICHRIESNSNDLMPIKTNKITENKIGKFIYFSFDPTFTEKIHKFITDNHSSWFCFLMTAYLATLHRLSDSEQLTVCYTIDTRDKKSDRAIGCFANVLPLVASLNGEMTFSELLYQVTKIRAEQKPHQEYPFLKITSELRKLQRSNIDSLLNIGLIEAYVKTTPLSLKSLHTISVIETENQAIYDLCLEYEFINKGIDFRLNYCSDFFEKKLVAKFQRYFQKIVNLFITSPEMQIANFSLLSKKEKEKILIEWNRTETSLSTDKLLTHLISDQASKTPKNTAIIFENQTVTYEELEEKSNQLAVCLYQNKNTNSNSVVPIILDRGVDRIISMLAILKAGFAYTPIDPQYPIERIAVIFKDCEPEQVILSENYEDKIAKAIENSGLKKTKKIIIEEKIKASSLSDVHRLPIISPKDLAYVLYTSGSTGKPKGVKISHTALLNLLLGIKKTLGVNANDNFINITSYVFDIAALEIYLPFLAGAYCFVPNQEALKSGQLLSQLVDKNNIHFVQTTPTNWQLLLDTGWHTNHEITILSTGEALPKQLASSLFAAAKCVWNLYGPTETTIWATAHLLKKTNKLKNISIGKPLTNTQAYVLDKYLQPTPIDRAGELYISGLCVADGYLGKPVLTKENFLIKPAYLSSTKIKEKKKAIIMYKTGDFVRWLPDGNLEYLGRKDQQIKHHGHRIELGDIESALLTHTSIKQAVVLSKKIHTKSDKKHYLIAYYTLKNIKKSPTEEELHRYLSEHLPTYFLPHKFILLKEMPLNQNNKIDRNALAYTKVSNEKGCHIILTRTENILCRIWEKQLGISPIDIKDNFYSLGGDSLSAIKIAYLVENQFNVECSAQIVFNHPTVTDLSSYLDTNLKEKKYIQFEKIKRRQPLPSSSAQKRFWFLSQAYFAGRSSYNVVLAWRITGKFNVALLEKSICLTIQRHEILRTTYPFRNGLLSQSIANIYAIHLQVEPISESQWSKIIAHEETHDFDFKKKPPYRIRLFEITKNKHILLFNLHHILIDNRALYLLTREISIVYKELLLGKNNFSLPELELQYADFSCWEFKKIHTYAFEESLDYWKKRLEGYQDLELPSMRDKVSDHVQLGNSFHFSIDGKKLEKIKTFCKKKKITLFTLLLSTYYILLSRYSRQNDIIVGVPVDQRASSAFENVIGCFVNTVPLRANLFHDISFIEFIKQVQRDTLSDFNHQYIPFDYLVDQLKIKRSDHQPPLVKTVFSMLYEGEIPLLELSDSSIEAVSIPITQPKFDLCFHFFETSSSLNGMIEYRLDVYDDANIRRMSQHFLNLLNYFIENHATSIKKFSLLGAKEKKKILFDWNQTYADYPKEKTVHELFEEQVAKNPNATAIVDQERCINYLDLDTRSSKLARFLINNGIKDGSLVPIFADRSIELVIGQLAVLKAGATFIPLSPKTPPERLRFILEETKAQVWLTKEKFHDDLQDSIGLKKTDISINLLCIDSIGLSIYKNKSHFDKIDPENLAYAIYTSGSTGQPKLVGVKHKSLINLIWWHLKEYHVSSHDKASVVSSEGFDALIWDIFPYLAAGASLYIPSTDVSLDCHKWASWIAKHEISIGFLPTPLVNHLLTANRNIPPNKLRFLLTGGDRLIYFPEKKYLFKIVNHYGLTETCVVATKFEVDAGKNSLYPYPPIGKPISNYIAYILDACLNPVPVNVPGELYIGGIGVETSYLNNSGLNQEKYIENPFNSDGNHAKLYRTGDLACWLFDGNIKYIGRIDNQIKMRGFRIELGEIENSLLSYPQIEQAVVILKSSRAIGEYLIAYMRTVQNVDIPNKLIINFLKQKLPAYMIPQHFCVIEKFPITTNGKIDRKALEKLAIKQNILNDVSCFKAIEKNSFYSVLVETLKEILEISSIDPNANFFDFGVHSLMLAQIVDKISQKIKINIQINDFLENTTVSQLADVIQKRSSASSLNFYTPNSEEYPHTKTYHNRINDIAVIAVSCQFPGSNNPAEFWDHLCQGNETISYFSDQQLRDAGISQTSLSDIHYVKARGIIQDADCFDAAFFNITPHEAILMDPQQRLFLQQASIALESAGYCPQKYDGSISVFAGADESHYLDHILKHAPNLCDTEDLQTIIANATQSFLSTKTSYKLGLTGASLNIHTACSTGLVVIDTACQYLRAHHCDIALAGAISIKQPQLRGYRYQSDSIFSPDGHCRAFDKNAAGTVPSSGIGLVVLKRLEQALEDGDPILAIIKSTSVNNDGPQKAGFTAPSVSGQTDCIRQALQSANINPESISYIETHGTGTLLGDPIEIKALTNVFSENTETKNFCPIGSVKTNIGHADAAAGMAGFIKTVLMLKNKKIPASLNYKQCNQAISFQDTPFFVNTKLRHWKKPDAYPRRAGVSAFGIGGTNAHVILEEAPEYQKTDFQKIRKYQILMLSAKTKTALDMSINNLGQHLSNLKQKKSSHEDETLANIAFTLQVGRYDFTERYAIICENIKEAVASIQNHSGVFSSLGKNDTINHKPKIIFLFPGQGTQYAQMGSTLYESEPIFKQAVDQCCELLKPYLNFDLRTILFPILAQNNSANHLLQQTQLTQPALFSIEYALAKLYDSWGIRPDALMGHSLGELTAAYLAGVFSLEDALRLLCIRGKLMSRLDTGAMLVVQAAPEALLPLPNDVYIASINTPHSCTVSGDHTAIDNFKNLLTKRSIIFQTVRTSHAFHSAMVEAIIPEFLSEVQATALHRSQIPVISNITGEWATADQLSDPNYWAQQLRQTVQFSKGIETIYQTLDNPLFLECGPGNTLINWIKQHKGNEQEHKTVFSMLSAKNHQESLNQGAQTIYAALANVWLYGADIDWAAYHANLSHQRIALPTYPFEKKRYWPEQEEFLIEDAPTINEEIDLSRCFYQPSWSRLELIDTLLVTDFIKSNDDCFIVFARNDELSDHLIQRLHALKQEVLCIYVGEEFKQVGEYKYTIDPKKYETYIQLFQTFSKTKGKNNCLLPAVTINIIHLWGADEKVGNFEDVSEVLYRGLYSITFLAKASATINIENNIYILLVNDHLQSVFSNDIVCATKSTVLGACQVIPLEYNHIEISTLDITGNKEHLSAEPFIDCIIAEALKISSHPDIKHLAYRSGYRWEKTYQPLTLSTELPTNNTVFKNKGVYLITGGLGGIGLSIATQILMTTSAHVALISRSVIPKSQAWEKWLDDHTSDHADYGIVKQLSLLKIQGASISVWSADVASYQQMNHVIHSIEKEIGAIQGIIHTAGIAGSGLIQKKNVDDIYETLQPKLLGAYVLSQLFKTKALDFVVLFSSLTALTGGIGQLDYCAANAALDAFPSGDYFHPDTFVSTINWNGWLKVGMYARSIKTSKNLELSIYGLNKNNTITPKEGFLSLSLALVKKINNLVISRVPLKELTRHVNKYNLSFALKNNKNINDKNTTEKLDIPEEKIVSIFKNILGATNININDDFFALGGDSLSALKLIETIDKHYGVRLSLNQIYHIKTPVQLAQFIQKPSYATSKSPLILLNSTKKMPPLFFIHPVGGTIFCYMPLAKQLEDHSPLYAIQDPGLIQPDYEFASLEAMASYYLTEIRKIQAHGPYHIGGYSMGGSIAFEIAHQLLQMGEKIDFLGLFDSWAIFTDQFHSKHFFEEKMRSQLENEEEKLKSSISTNIDDWLARQWKRMQLLLNYQPKILDCKITLFKAQTLLAEYKKINDPYNHWQKYSTISVECFKTPGDHDTLMLTPHIKALSDLLLKSLSQLKIKEVQDV